MSGPMVWIKISRAELIALSRLVMYSRALTSVIEADAEQAAQMKNWAQMVEDILARPRMAESMSERFLREVEENKPK